MEPCHPRVQWGMSRSHQKLTARELGQAGGRTTRCAFSGLAEKPPHFLLPNCGFLGKEPQKQQLYLPEKAQLTKKK